MAKKQANGTTGANGGGGAAVAPKYPGPLIRLEVNGFRGLASFECEPSGGNLQVDGDNGVGKSSATDALAWALGEDVAGEVVHNGADGAEVLLKWRAADGTILDVRRSKTRTGKPALAVKAGKDKKGEPATLLAGERGTVGRRTFSALPASEQIAIVKRIAPGLDTGDLDAERQRVYAERTEVNRDAKALRAQAEGVSVPPPVGEIGEEKPIIDVIDLAAIAERKAAVAEMRAKNERVRESAQRARREADVAESRRRAAAMNVEAAERALRLAREAEDEATAACAKAEERALAAERDAAALTDPDTTAIDREIVEAREKNAAARRAAEVHNQMVRAAQAQHREHERALAERTRFTKLAEEKESASGALTAKIDQLDAEKLARITAATGSLPIHGLAIADGIVTIDDGVHGPVEARIGVLNDAACMELDVRLAAAQGHRLVVLKNAERLGKAARARIGAIAREYGIQAVYEVRTDGAELHAEVIEDGEAAVAETQAPPVVVAVPVERSAPPLLTVIAGGAETVVPAPAAEIAPTAEGDEQPEFQF